MILLDISQKLQSIHSS